MKKGNVFITGGSRGIGAELVRTFASKGYTVAFTYAQSQKAAEALASESGAHMICADSAKREDVARAVAVFHDTVGIPDVLIHNAAISQIQLFTQLSDAQWEHMRTVNLDSVIQYTKLFLPGMIAQKKGRILQITSMWGQVGASCEVAYSTTKAALIGFTKALAKEVGPSGINVNAIAPGIIQTEMNEKIDKVTMDALCEETPLGRIGTPKDVADLALFLAEEGGNFITGQVIAPNGGFVI